MTSQQVLRFVTWNTNGIKGTPKSPNKLSDVLESLNEIQTDIAFIQETHIGPKDCDIWNNATGWTVYFTVYKPESKGVAVLIRNSVPFEYICHDEDYSGGYIVLFCRLYGELYTLVNMYNHKNDKNVLIRLKEYLLETAQGVLLVGGDFNTVLHPSFDRKSEGYKMSHSPLRSILEDFIFALYLRDTWTYLNPTDEGFTRQQNESQSRIDLFFSPENTLGRACDIRTEHHQISDHNPLVLEFRIQQQSGNEIPNVASELEEFQYTPDRAVEKINGAEILRAIKSLTYSEEQSDVTFYKNNRCPKSEILKKKFNDILKTKKVPNDFKTAKVEYLIFKRILANRLSEFLTPSFKEKIDNLDNILTVNLANSSQKIKWSFLENRLRNLDQTGHTPPPDLSILDLILPTGSHSDLRCLKKDCPLTKPILNLALKELYSTLSMNCTTSVCYHRQALHVHTTATQPDTNEAQSVVNKFRVASGIVLNVKPE